MPNALQSPVVLDDVDYAASGMLLEHLQDVLDTHFFAVCVNSAEAERLNILKGLLTQHCQLIHMQLLLREVLQKPQVLENIAKRSYWHGNGFLKIVLIDSDQLGYKLRLHVWFDDVGCEENIHSHRWGFASHILTGVLKSEIWQPVAAHTSGALLLDEYEYTAQQGQRAAFMVKQGKTALFKHQDIAHESGDSYIMTRDQLHKINHPADKLVATVICTEPTCQITNRLFPSIDTPALQPQRLDSKALDKALRTFLQQTGTDMSA